MDGHDELQIAVLLEGDLSDLEGVDDSDPDIPDEDIALLENRNRLQPEAVEIEVADMPGLEIIPPDADEGNIIPYNILIENQYLQPEVDPAAKNQLAATDPNNVNDDSSPIESAGINSGSVVKSRKVKLRWRYVDIDPVDTTCNVQFKDPPLEMTPYQYFKSIFTDDIVNNLVLQSNLYSIQKTGVSLDSNSNEMEQFIGINVISSLVKMPSYRMYWASNTRFPPIADTIARNRFDKMRTFLHINDNSHMKPKDHPQYDKLFKVRPFLDTIKAGFKSIEPEEFSCVDEIMVPFKGHSRIKQYIKNKPHKWGIKVFGRASVSGIVHDFEVYVGKGTLQQNTALGISGDIVVRLVEDLPKNQNYKLFTDNWFTSFNLIQNLKEMGILAVGNIRINRLPRCELSTDKEMKKNGRGTVDYRTEVTNNIIALKW